MIKKNKIYNLLTKVIILITFVIILKIYRNQELSLKTKTIASLEPLSPIVSTFSSFQYWLNDLFHFNQLRNNYLKLKQENIALIEEVISLRALKEENETLKQVLKLKEEKKWQLVPAKVILIDPSGLSGNFWINKGEENGLKAGMNIITDNEVLVGRIIQCLKNSCLCESIVSPGVKISVENTRSKILAVVEKDYKGNFYLKLVPPMADIEIGDILITSSENNYYLKGLLVARIKDKISGSKMADKEYLLEPLFNRSKIENVLVITNFYFK